MDFSAVQLLYILTTLNGLFTHIRYVSYFMSMCCALPVLGFIVFDFIVYCVRIADLEELSKSILKGKLKIALPSGIREVSGDGDPNIKVKIPQ